MKILDEVVDAEIASFRDGGLYWYDGLSWLTEQEITSGDRESAYGRVFARLLDNGRASGMLTPYIHHNGNGHYVVVEGDRLPADR